VVRQVTQSHRGQSEQDITEAITDRLRSLGVVPVRRQIQQYAEAIACLPELPPPRPVT
jgi:hypothetical protein